MPPKRPAPKSKKSNPTSKKGGTLPGKQPQRRRKNGQFAKKPGPKKATASKPVKRRAPVKRQPPKKVTPPKRKPSKPKGPTRTRVITQDKNGRYRDENNRFVKVIKAPIVEAGHHDDRVNDGPRYRNRLTFQEMVNLYGFDDYEDLPEWTMYLEGAP